MDSIIYIIALSILIIFIYGYFLNFYDKYKNINRMYIPIDKSIDKNKRGMNIESDSIESDSIELDSIELDSIESDSIESDSIELDSIVSDSIELDSIESDSIELDSIELDSIVSDSIDELDGIELDKKMKELDSIDKYIIQQSNSNTCNIDDDCFNGGLCKDNVNDVGTTYKNCSCIQPFSGDNCKNNVGTRVMITDNFTSPITIERVPMYTNDLNQYNNYL